MHRRFLYVLAAVVLLAASAVAIRSAGGADGTVEFTGASSAATFVSADSRGTNYNNAAVLNASRTSYRALLQFATGIPVGSTVNSATLVIDPANTDGGVFQVYNVGSFDPATVTWNNRPALGGTVLGTSPSPTGGSAQTIPLVGLNVGPVTNVAVSYSQPGFIAKFFGLPNNAPVLDVVYTPPGGTTTTTASSNTTTTAGPGTTTTTAPPPTTTTTTAVPPTTTTTQPTSGIGNKVLVIMEENHTAGEFFSSLPYLGSLASTYGHATDYNAISHPSLPNYLATFGGSTFGTSTDCAVGCGPTSSDTSVFDQTIAAGSSARAYIESMPSNCDVSNSGEYATKHNPWPYFFNATSQANCAADDVPLTQLQADITAGALPTTGEITPNLDDDWHDGTAAQANAFLQTWVPALMAGPDYTSGHLSIVITADEDDNSSPNVVPFVVVNPALSGVVVTAAFNHYSLTRWLDDNAGAPPLNNAATATDIGSAFGL
jgi:hypothetical protein